MITFSEFGLNVTGENIKELVNPNPYLIESVDSYELAEKINNATKEKKTIQKILIQVKTDEKKDTGLEPDDL